MEKTNLCLPPTTYIMVYDDDVVILPDEGGVLEYKIQLTEKREFVKEIVALANLGGGRIRIGVTNGKEIRGIKNLSIEAITSVGRDHCFPPIIPDVSRQNIGGKEIIVVDIPAGRHTPYRTDGGRYMIRVGPTVRDASVDELIDLIVKGPQKGTILLRASVEDLEISILAAIRSGNEGTQDAIQGITKLIHLITNASSERAVLGGFSILASVAKASTGFNNRVTNTIVSQITLLPSYLIYDHQEKKPSRETVNKAIDILESIFGTLTIVPKEIDLIRECLTSLYRMAMCCIYAHYENEKLRICKIIEEKSSWYKIDKHCKKALEMINELPSFSYMPQRLALFIQRV